MSISNRLGSSHIHVMTNLTLWNQSCFVTVQESLPVGLPEEFGHPPVLLIAYCDYLVQAESLTGGGIVGSLLLFCKSVYLGPAM